MPLRSLLLLLGCFVFVSELTTDTPTASVWTAAGVLWLVPMFVVKSLSPGINKPCPLELMDLVVVECACLEL